MTYESASEAEVLKSFWRPGAPLENTVFVICDPYGRPLIRGSRGPEMYFRDASDMAAALNEIASHYRSSGDPQSLPAVLTVRLGMDVAACDKLPLVIVVADNEMQRKAMEQTLAPLSWSDDFIGKLTYTSGRRSDLRNVQGATFSDGYCFVSPNEFGTSGTVIAQLAENASPAQLKTALQTAINQHHPLQLDHREHVRMGREQGIHWDTAIPITDPQEQRAEQMGRSGGPGGFRPYGGPPMPGGPFGGGPPNPYDQ